MYSSFTPIGFVKQDKMGLHLLWSGSGLTSTIHTPCHLTFYTSNTQAGFNAYLGIFYNDVFQYKKELSYGFTTIVLPIEKETNVKIIKLTEQQYGDVILTTPLVLSHQPIAAKSILFIGDSLSAGYGVEGNLNDGIFTCDKENVTKAYTYLCAKALAADAYIIASSGNGVLSRYVEPMTTKPNTQDLLPTIFPYDIPYSFGCIVINLGTNDASYIQQDKAKTQAFLSAYLHFIQNLEKAFPLTKIILTYGLMEESLVGPLQNFASQHDLHFIRLPHMQKEDGIGLQDHPSSITHQKTAAFLAKALQEEIGW